MRRALLALGLAAGAAHAEGAARVVECQALRECDGAGLCAESGDAVRFRLEPEALAADGSGRFRIDRGDGPVEGRGLGDAGPWVWVPAAGGRETLVLLDETHALWASRGADGAAHVRFLTCEVTQ